VKVAQRMALAMGRGNHGKAGEATFRGPCRKPHGQLVLVEQAGQPRTAIVVGW